MGKVFKFGDNVDTDCIVPGRYLSLTTHQELAKVCMEGYEEGFSNKIAEGDVFVAENNFGCGSSREHAPISIKAAGVKCIIANSFARIFYRSAINIGLPVLESPEAVKGLNAGDECRVSLSEGIIYNETTGKAYEVAPYPKQIQEIIDKGGMIEYVKCQKNRL